MPHRTGITYQMTEFILFLEFLFEMNVFLGKFAALFVQRLLDSHRLSDHRGNDLEKFDRCVLVRAFVGGKSDREHAFGPAF